MTNGKTVPKPLRGEPSATVKGFPEGYLGYQLARASHLVTSTLHEQLAKFGVSVATWRILTAVLDQERNITEIGQLVLMKQSALSRALDRLEKDGLIARRRNDTERRVVYVRLTASGRKLAETLRSAASFHERSLRGLFSSADLRQLSHLLDGLISTLSERS